LHIGGRALGNNLERCSSREAGTPLLTRAYPARAKDYSRRWRLALRLCGAFKNGSDHYLEAALSGLVQKCLGSPIICDEMREVADLAQVVRAPTPTLLLSSRSSRVGADLIIARLTATICRS
jgi:hypothetical protein